MKYLKLLFQAKSTKSTQIRRTLSVSAKVNQRKKLTSYTSTKNTPKSS